MEFEIYKSLFPNPTSEGVYFEVSENLDIELVIDIYTIDGKHLRQERLDHNRGVKYIDLSNYENGLFLIKFKGFSKSWTERVLLNKP